MIRKVDGNFVQLIKPYWLCCPAKSVSKWLGESRGEERRSQFKTRTDGFYNDAIDNWYASVEQSMSKQIGTMTNRKIHRHTIEVLQLLWKHSPESTILSRTFGTMKLSGNGCKQKHSCPSDVMIRFMHPSSQIETILVRCFCTNLVTIERIKVQNVKHHLLNLFLFSVGRERIWRPICNSWNVWFHREQFSQRALTKTTTTTAAAAAVTTAKCFSQI